MSLKKIIRVLLPLGYTAAILAFIFLASTLGWISISNFTLKDFFPVLQLIIKRSGSYGALLAAIVATIFFQSYTGMKADEKAREDKIRSIGHYAVSIPGKIANPILIEETMLINLVEKDSDFKALSGSFSYIKLEFETSKASEGYMRNIMAFEEDYFNKNKREILKNYLKVYQKSEYLMPLFVRVFPVQKEETKTPDSDFILRIRVNGNENKCFFISAITDSGVLYFIRVKMKIEADKSNNYKFIILQQTNYYVQNGKLEALV